MEASLAKFMSANQSEIVLFVCAAIFLLVSAVTYGVASTLRSREEIRRRALFPGGVSGDVQGRRRNPAQHKLAGTSRLLSSVASNFVPADKKSVSSMRKDLTQAGFFKPSAVAWYFFIRIVLAVLLPALLFIVNGIWPLELETTQWLGLLAGSSALGLFLPSIVVSRRKKMLQQQCRNGFPDFLDLLVVCAEAGIAMEAALQRVSTELAQTYPFLGVNLHMASLELRAGRPLIEAFNNLADRIGIEDAYNLGSLLQQSDELGTSLSDALRVYSDEMRDKRMSRAEEKAHALPAKITVPLIMFVFPSILIVIMLPVVVKFGASF
ncbi:MAG: type II secretion system F family protein [Hyphomicrobiales bacterium]|nr:type II secretion system F family protein [Hyphomicrobiales bacterium]